MNKIKIPAVRADQWAQFLADPSKQWKIGYSARALAHSWQEANGFSEEIRAAFEESGGFRDIELLLAIPEHQVPLPGGSRRSQTDVWVLAKSEGDLLSIAVEGKVAESFGPTLGEWRADESSGKRARLAFIRGELGFPDDFEVPGSIRYQLLHRTASAIIEAKRFCAQRAMMLVHSFSQTHDWFSDYVAFVSLFGAGAEIGKIVDVGCCGSIRLSLGWICGDAKYLFA